LSLRLRQEREREKNRKFKSASESSSPSFETTCLVTPSCQSYPALESEVEAIRKNLEEVLKQAREVFEGASKKEKLGLRSDMKAEEIWTILSAILDEGEFIQSFNALEREKRKEVAEHVLTHCSVFSGRAAVSLPATTTTPHGWNEGGCGLITAQPSTRARLREPLTRSGNFSVVKYPLFVSISLSAASIPRSLGKVCGLK